MIMYFHLLHMYAMRGKENWMRFILILMQGRKEASLQRKACKKNIPILFLSDDIERAKDIFRINPIYFLTRPYEEDYVKDSLYKIIQIVDEDSAELLTIGNPESKKGDSVVLLKDIYYIESQKRVINIHYYDGFSTYYYKLDEVEKKLKKNFLRTHQSFIVNLDKVKKLVNDGLLLYGGTIVPISRSRYKDVVGTVSRYLNIGEEA